MLVGGEGGAHGARRDSALTTAHLLLIAFVRGAGN